MIETVKVGEQVIDYNILPRAAVDFTHVGVLKNALLAGVAFPPIVAERRARDRSGLPRLRGRDRAIPRGGRGE